MSISCDPRFDTSADGDCQQAAQKEVMRTAIPMVNEVLVEGNGSDRAPCCSRRTAAN
jgi:hypothetical protein